jgi:hypothetical protein
VVLSQASSVQQLLISQAQAPKRTAHVYPWWTHQPQHSVRVRAIFVARFSVTRGAAQLAVAPTMQPQPQRRIEFGEGDEILGPIRGLFDNGKNPPLPFAAAVGAVPLDLTGELYLVRRPRPRVTSTPVHRAPVGSQSTPRVPSGYPQGILRVPAEHAASSTQLTPCACGAHECVGMGTPRTHMGLL